MLLHLMTDEVLKNLSHMSLALVAKQWYNFCNYTLAIYQWQLIPHCCLKFRLAEHQTRKSSQTLWFEFI